MTNPEIPIHRSHVSGMKRFIRVWRDRETQREWKELKYNRRKSREERKENPNESNFFVAAVGLFNGSWI